MAFVIVYLALVFTSAVSLEQTCRGNCSDGMLLLQAQSFNRMTRHSSNEVAMTLRMRRNILKNEILGSVVSMLKSSGVQEDEAWQILSMIQRKMSVEDSYRNVSVLASWPQDGDDNQKCDGDEGHKVESQSQCESEAGAKGHNFFSFNNETKMCSTSSSCGTPEKHQSGWAIFRGFAHAGSAPRDWTGFAKNLMDKLDEMLKSVADEHAVSQGYVQQVTERFNHCHTTSTSASNEAKYLSNIPRHVNCRSQARSSKQVLDACVSEKAAEKLTMHSTTSTFEAVSVKPSDAEWNVLKPAAESKIGWLDRTIAHLIAERDEYKKKEEDMKQATNAFEGSNCDAQNIEFQAVEKDCNSTLAEIWLAARDWAHEVKSLCENYDTCYDDHVFAYKLLKDEVTQEVAARKSEFQMSKRMQCLLSAITSTGTIESAKLKTCDDHGQYNDQALNVRMLADPPEKQKCSAPTTYPCNDAYNADVYGHIKNGERLASECAPMEGMQEKEKYVYKGCYNRGSRKSSVTFRSWTKAYTWAECKDEALKNGYSWFALQWPQPFMNGKDSCCGWGGEGWDKAPIKADTTCEKDKDSEGNRLGGAYHYAAYVNEGK